MHTYSVRDLREHTGDLIHGAEEGNLALITKHSKPVFLAVPFNEFMLLNGIQVAVAVEVYRQHVVSLGKAAKIAKLPIEEFMEKLAAFGIPIVDYPPEEIKGELQIINKHLKK
jgi:predicted HTH domain antitoxin